MKRPRGICQVCGCTDADGCPEGCSWANAGHSLCSVCKPLGFLDRLQKRDSAVAGLRLRLAGGFDAVRELRSRGGDARNRKNLERAEDRVIDLKARLGALGA